MSTYTKGKKATGASKVKNAGLSLMTNVGANNRVDWEKINSAPVTKKEYGIESEPQKSAKLLEALASVDWRSRAAFKVRTMKENQSINDVGTGSTKKKSDSELAEKVSSPGATKQHAFAEPAYVKGIAHDDAFIDAIFDLPSFTAPVTAPSSEGASPSSSTGHGGGDDVGEPCLVKIEGVGKMTYHDTKHKVPANKNFLFSVTPVTQGEMKYISSNNPATRIGLGELHVAKHRARAFKSQDDADAEQVARATLPMTRTASISPEFLSKNAGARYDTVKSLREGRRVQNNDPAILHLAGHTGSDEAIIELSPHRTSPTRSAKEAARKRFSDIIQRLKQSRKSPVPSDPAIISCRIKEPSKAAPRAYSLNEEKKKKDESSHGVTDRAQAQLAKWGIKVHRADSGYSSPPRDPFGFPTAHQRHESKDSTAAIASNESSPKKQSTDSGFDSPNNKAKTLNPKAIEFVSIKDKKQPATIGGGGGLPAKFPRKPISDLFIPPQQQQEQPAALTRPALFDMGPPPMWMPTITTTTPTLEAITPQQLSLGTTPNICQLLAAAAATMPRVAPPPATSTALVPYGLLHHPMATATPAPVMPISTPPTALMATIAPTPATTVPAAAATTTATMAGATGALGPFVGGRPPAPCRKPRQPDPIAQQNYEAYIEHRKYADPAYALECKRRQARRWEKQQQNQMTAA